MGRIIIVFLKRLWLPLLVLAAFLGVCVVFYMRVEGLRPLDALFWVIHPHSIEYLRVHRSTKIFSIFVYAGVFALQIWIAERVLLTIFSRHGVEAWRTMINEVNVNRLHDHFIICGYGQVGRTVVDQLQRLEIPFVLIETNEGLYRELLNDKIPVIQGDAKRHDVLLQAGIDRARGICIVIDNDADNLYITVTSRSLNPKIKIITRAGQQRYANAIRSSGADEVIIPEYEGGSNDRQNDPEVLPHPAGDQIEKIEPGSEAEQGRSNADPERRADRPGRARLQPCRLEPIKTRALAPEVPAFASPTFKRLVNWHCRRAFSELRVSSIEMFQQPLARAGSTTVPASDGRPSRSLRRRSGWQLRTRSSSTPAQANDRLGQLGCTPQSLVGGGAYQHAKEKINRTTHAIGGKKNIVVYLLGPFAYSASGENRELRQA